MAREEGMTVGLRGKVLGPILSIGMVLGLGGVALADAQLDDMVKQAMAPRTAEESQLPTTGPAAQPGKKLVSIVCASAIEGCRAISEAQVEAAKALGWTTQVIDGRGSVKGWDDAIQSAIQTKPDVIALAAILPSAVASSLADAKAAGITVVCTQCGANPDEPGIDAADGDEVNGIIGDDLGKYIAQKAGGKASVLMWYYPEFGISKLRHDAAKEALAKYCDCKVQSIEVKISEWNTSLPERVNALLLQNPDISWIYSPADETAIDAANAIKAGGRSGQVHVAGGNGNLQALDAIKTDPDYVATAAVSYAFSAWSSVDNANRILAGEKPVKTRTAVRVIDASNSSAVPAGQYYGGDVDFREHYKKLWGK
jgi:ribose transport system substrate-binding protein